MIAELFAWPSPAIWVAPLGHALLAFLWQGIAIGLGTGLILASLRDAKPQTRYNIACFALLLCIVVPLSTLWRSVTMPSGDAIATTTAIAAIAPHASQTSPLILPISWSSSIDTGLPWIVALWSLGVIVMLLRLIAGTFWVRRLRTEATAAIDPTILQRFEALCARMGVSSAVRLRVLTNDAIALASPIAAGMIAPVVILPAALLARMPSDMLEALIAHELAHIRRHDYLINLLQAVIEALLFYHPVVWWLSRRIRHERELIADDLAANVLDTPRTLAVALAELDRIHAEFNAATPSLARFPLALSQAARGGPLMSRIQRLVQAKHPSVGIGVGLPLIGLTAFGLACFAYAQSDRPQAAQSLIAKESPTAGATKREALSAPTLSVQQTSSESGVTGLVVNAKLDIDTSSDIDSNDDREGKGYALIREGQEGFSMSGDLDDIDRIRAAKARIDGDFMWFRRDGKAYVIRDPATLARVQTAWRNSEANEAKMRSLGAEMEAKSQTVQALAQQVSAQAAEQAVQASRIHERVAQAHELAEVKRLAEQQTKLAQQEAELASRYAQNPLENEDEYERESAVIEAQSAELELRMEAIEAKMEAKGAKIEAEIDAKMTGMESELEARLEAATQPLEALGAQMEALGEAQERIMADVDRAVGREIDRALREKLAEPAPGDDTRQ